MKTKDYSKNIIFSENKNKFLNEYCFNIQGSFSLITKQKKNYLCTRDMLGTKKLFYGINQNKIHFSNNFIDLLKFCKHESIKSIPKGSRTLISSKGKSISSKEIYSNIKNSNFKLKERLMGYMEQVRKLENQSTCIVCLSGGLDSTIIAYFLKKKFRKVIAVTAYCDDNLNAIQNDLRSAQKISKALNIMHLPVPIKINEVKKKLNKILYTSQDWRDYNVHCGAINYFLAKFLKKKGYGKYPVFTGDFMNEFVADYETEKVNDKYFYKMSLQDKKLKQRFLINSLDSSSREISVFNHFKIALYQPYSILAFYYKNISSKILRRKNFKYSFNGKLLPKKILNLVLNKKTRAQSGDSSGGMIKYFEKLNLDQKKIEKKFDKIFNTNKKWRKEFINLGCFKI
jgi:asparagine synthetase B (glutamine-hydrolysing)